MSDAGFYKQWLSSVLPWRYLGVVYVLDYLVLEHWSSKTMPLLKGKIVLRGKASHAF